MPSNWFDFWSRFFRRIRAAVRIRMLLIASASVLSVLAGCGDSSKVSAPQSNVVSGSQPSQPKPASCASGERYLRSAKNPDQVGDTEPLDTQYLETYGFYNPIFCAELTDQAIANAAANLVRQFPHLCDGIAPRPIRGSFKVYGGTLLKDTVAVFNQSTQGGPRGAFMPDKLGYPEDGIIDSNYRQKHPIDEDMPVVQDPPQGLPESLKNSWGITAMQELAVEDAAKAYCQ